MGGHNCGRAVCVFGCFFFFYHGLVKKNNIRDYWTTNPLLATPFFGTVFSQDRFLLLLRCLHFSNTTSTDPLRKIPKTIKWYRKLFFYVLDVAVFNSYVVHRQLTGQDMTYHRFRENLVHQLMEEYHTARRPSCGGRPTLDTPLRLSARHFPTLVTQTAQQGGSNKAPLQGLSDDNKASPSAEGHKEHLCPLRRPTVCDSLFRGLSHPQALLSSPSCVWGKKK